MTKKNPFPGVTKVTDRHGKARWRYRAKGFSCYIPGPYGSAEFRAAYEAARAQGKRPPVAGAARGTLSWLIAAYLDSARFRNLAASSRASQRRQFDWLRDQAGDLPFACFAVRHVEALMERKTGPAAANAVAKRLSSLFAYACRMGHMAANPAAVAEKHKVLPGGYHTWTEGEVDKFRGITRPAARRGSPFF